MQAPKHKSKYGFLEYRNGNDEYCVVFQRTLTDWGSDVYQLNHDDMVFVENNTYYVFKNGKLKNRYDSEQKGEFLEHLELMDQEYERIIRMNDEQDALPFLRDKCWGVEW